MAATTPRRRPHWGAGAGNHIAPVVRQACDRIIVLGRGRTLLDLSIAEAMSHHRVVEGDVASDGAAVGSFPAPAGDRLTLARVPVVQPLDSVVAAPGRPATLEEIVIGHMAAGRRREEPARAEREAA
jgi:hypothetical protein